MKPNLYQTREGRAIDGQGHIPVLVEEVISLLRCSPHQVFVDATLGGGGHAREILERTAPDGIVIGIEQDADALSEARKVLGPFGERVKIVHENFVHLPAILGSLNLQHVDGMLFDLGISSLQLGDANRGFSFKGGPLDMRMDRRIERTAADCVNQATEADLADILFRYGEERWSRRIARSIVEERSRMPIETTQTLRALVHRAIPRRFHSRRIDPATKTFQALRILVNDELDNLKQVLESAWGFIRPGGRLCIISFHSLEDRIVKEAFRSREKGEGASQENQGVIRIVTRKPIVPSEEEQRRNPRSRSAKLRCAERGGG